MGQDLDLDAYFERIGWGEATPPTYATLAGILRGHVSSIPFENLDILFGREVSLDLAALEDKLIRRRRGGYCFEQATLLQGVLRLLGFEVLAHSARVVRASSRTQAPRLHMILTTSIDGETYILDPGFSAFSSTAPLQLSLDETGSPSHKLSRENGELVLTVQHKGVELRGWTTSLEVENAIDFEIENYYAAHHPQSLFKNVLMASANTPNGRVSLMNTRLTLGFDSQCIEKEILSRVELREIFADHFGIDLSEIEKIIVPAVAGWR